MGNCIIQPKGQEMVRSFSVKKIDQNQRVISEGSLDITTVELVYHCKDQEPIRWPFSGLRRYGFETSMLMFEAGSRCMAGEGMHWFIFKQSGKAFRLIDDGMQRISSRRTKVPEPQPDSRRRTSSEKGKLNPPSPSSISSPRTHPCETQEDYFHNAPATSSPERNDSKQSDSEEAPSPPPPPLSPRGHQLVVKSDEVDKAKSDSETKAIVYSQLEFGPGGTTNMLNGDQLEANGSVTQSPRLLHAGSTHSLPRSPVAPPRSPHQRTRNSSLVTRPTDCEGSPKGRIRSHTTTTYSRIDQNSTLALAQAMSHQKNA